MLDRDRVVADKRLLISIQNGPTNVFSSEWIGSIKNQKFNVLLSGRLHRQTHRGNVSVEPCSDILDVEHQSIQSLQHLGGRSSCFAIEAEDL